MPDDPGGTPLSIQSKYLNYENLVEMYKDFAFHYAQINRVWKGVPLFTEVDTFLDFLYHHHKYTPTYKYKNKGARDISKKHMVNDLKKYTSDFQKFAEYSMIQWRLESIKIARKIFLNKH